MVERVGYAGPFFLLIFCRLPTEVITSITYWQAILRLDRWHVLKQTSVESWSCHLLDLFYTLNAASPERSAYMTRRTLSMKQ